MSTALDPRAEYRRRLARRQTIVIGTILTVMAALTVICLLIWSGLVPAPYDPGFSEAKKETVQITQPCPPADAVTVEVTSVPVNVYNGTDTAGLAGDVTEQLTDAGLTVTNTADWPRGSYDGDVLLTSSPAGVVGAYSLARAFSGTVLVTIDETAAADDATVSVVLGAQYKNSLLEPADIAKLPVGEAITAPEQCEALAPSAAPSASDDAA